MRACAIVLGEIVPLGEAEFVVFGVGRAAEKAFGFRPFLGIAAVLVRIGAGKRGRVVAKRSIAQRKNTGVDGGKGHFAEH